MVEQIVNAITGSLKDSLPKELIVFFISMIPILELRGSILAAGFLKMEFLSTFIIAVVGNMLPIPFVLLFIDKIFELLKKTKLKNIVERLEKRALAKSGQIEKYGFWGLLLFVGIPLPGTGAWTGALAASLLRMRKSKAILAIFLGVVLAGLIMSLLAFGIIKQVI